MRKTIRTELIGNATLYVVEITDDSGLAPIYEMERTVRSAGNSPGPLVAYGKPGLSSLDEAIEIGREWCRAP